MASVAIAIGLNVLAFATLMAWGLGHRLTGETEAAAALPPAEIAALDPSCDGDALLRAVARAAVCATPLADNDDLGACLDAARQRLDIDEMLCHVDQMQTLPAVAVLDQKQIERIAVAPIEAEKLLEPLTPEEQQQFQEQQQQPTPPPAPEVAPPPPPPPPKSMQVIEAPKPTDQQAPDHAEYLSEFDSTVDKQKASHGNPNEEMVAKPKAEELQAKKDAKDPSTPKPPNEAIGKNPDAPKLPGALSMRSPGAPDTGETEQQKQTAGATDGSTAPLGDGTTRKRGTGQIDQDEHHPVETATGQGGAGGGAPRAPNLRPDDETLDRLVGGGSVDKLDDVDEGDENAFNTKQWIYASFFNRMKRIVAQNWDPSTVWHREDPDGTHYGFKPRITVLRVSLDAHGAVQKILVVEPCGLDALDDEAIRAFKEAAPFPNPPQALVDHDGMITFAFSFDFEIDSKHTSWKMYRSI